jgi:hypothetical protein
MAATKVVALAAWTATMRTRAARSSALGLALAALALLGACAMGTPPGFSDGDSWSAPLVGPLENSAILVPVRINGAGPYLFMVDPDSPVSSVDAAIMSELDLYNRLGGYAPSEADVMVNMRGAEVRTISVGNLTVSNRRVRVHDVGAFMVNGRLVRGLLGRDVIADSLVLAIDRDKGLLHIATQGHLEPPAGAEAIGYYYERGPGLKIPSRRIANVTVNRSIELRMHLDLGAPTCMIWPKLIEDAKLPHIPMRTSIVDELGQRQVADHGSIAAMFKVGHLELHAITLLPYSDKRWREVDLDGAVGLNFFSQYHVTVNWHREKFYLAPRSLDVREDATERLRRWGGAFDACASPACVSIVAADGRIEVSREPNAPEQAYELLIDARGPAGEPLGLPPLVVSLPKGVRSVFEPDLAEYAGATLTIVDLSPFPPPCRESGDAARCIWPLAQVR